MDGLGHFRFGFHGGGRGYQGRILGRLWGPGPPGVTEGAPKRKKKKGKGKKERREKKGKKRTKGIRKKNGKKEGARKKKEG